MKFEKNEHSTDSLIKFLEKKFGKKVTDEPFTKGDIAQYLRRGMTPYRYGGYKLSSKKVGGVRVITIEKENA